MPAEQLDRAEVRVGPGRQGEVAEAEQEPRPHAEGGAGGRVRVRPGEAEADHQQDGGCPVEAGHGGQARGRGCAAL